MSAEEPVGPRPVSDGSAMGASPDLSAMQRPMVAAHRLSVEPAHLTMVHLARFERVTPRELTEATRRVLDSEPVLRARLRGMHLVDGGVVPVLGPSRVEAGAARSRAVEVASTAIDLSHGVGTAEILDGPDGTWLILALHHAVTDAASHRLVLARIAEVAEGATPPVGTPHHEVVGRLTADGPARSRALEGWRDHGPVERTGWARTRHSADVAGRAHRHAELLDDVLVGRIRHALDGPRRALTDDLGWTGLLAAALALVSHRQTGRSTVEIDLPVHHRRTPAAASSIGPLMETFPVSIDIDPDHTLEEHAAASLAAVIATLRRAQPDTGPTGRSGLFLNVVPASRPIDGVTSHRVVGPTIDPEHVLEIQLARYGDRPSLHVSVNAADATAADAARTVQLLRAALRDLCGDDAITVGAWCRPSAEELERLSVWGGLHRPIPPVPDLVERLARSLDHDRVVLTDAGRSWTGREVWSTAGQLAHTLVDTHGRLGLAVGRSDAAVLHVLAALRAGVSVVPLDPDHPEPRRRRLAERAGCGLVLDDTMARERTGSARARAADAGDPAPVTPVDPDREAYLLFTSGSTGEPKGVPIPRRGLDRYVEIATAYTDAAQPPVVPLVSALTFDLTMTSLFLPLVTGGRLEVVPGDGPAAMAAVAAEPSFTWLKATPSHAELLVRRLGGAHGLRVLVLGGEALRSDLAERLRSVVPDLRIINEYGPTEAVVGCMIHELDPADLGRPDVPIGRPAPGVALRIVDPETAASTLVDVAPGRPGELVISTDGLTPGYLGGEGDDRFVDDGDRRWYRSGDLVRLVDLDGLDAAEYLGRIDRQVKIGGVRLDPSEVEAELLAVDGVDAAVAGLATAPGGRRTVWTAWVVADTDAHLDAVAIRAAIAAQLPEVAVPAHIVFIDTIPLTSNGKVDHDALPAPDGLGRPAGPTAGPSSALLDEIVGLWRSILDVPGLGPDDDVVALGADSLAALEFCLALGERHDRDIPERLPRLAPTPREQAEVLTGADGVHRPPPGQRAPNDAPALTDGELALLFEHPGNESLPQYHVGRRFEIPAGVRIEPERWHAAASRVVERHEPLRWTWRLPRRCREVSEALEFAAVGPIGDDAVDALLDDWHRRSFSLIEGPSMRLLIVERDHGPTTVFVVVHHLSADAPSFEILWRELTAELRGEPLPTPATDVASVGAWHRRHRADVEHTWPGEPETPLAALPPAGGDEPDGLITLTDALAADADGRGPDLARVLAAFASVVARRSEHTAVELDVIISSRTHRRVEDLIGYFLTTVPVVVEVDPDRPLTELEAELEPRLDVIAAHRDVPRGRIDDVRRRRGRETPTTSLLVAVDRIGELTLDGVPVDHRPRFNGAAVADLTLFVETRGSSVDLLLEHRGSTIGRSAARTLLGEVADLLRAPGDRAPNAILPAVGSSVLHGPLLDARPHHGVSIAEHLAEADLAPAITAGADTMSWRRLGTRVAVLADLLDDAVPDRASVLLPLGRTTDAVAAMLACWATGRVPIPVDPAQPVDRVDQLVDASGAAAALVHDDGRRWSPDDLLVPPADAPAPADAVARAGARLRALDLAAVAYVIFTSGSTGVPRGVPVSHRALAASNGARFEHYPERPRSFLVVSNLAFDSSIAGLVWTLAAGGEIVLPVDGEATDPTALAGLLLGASHTLMVPTLYDAVLRSTDGGVASRLERVIVAGEACPEPLVHRHHEVHPSVALTNEYGPTEATVWCSAIDLRVGEPVTIGRPIPGVTLIVADPNGRTVPPGVPGELVVVGPGVVDGYLDGSGGHRFTTHEGRTAFRTGDRVRLDDAHRLEFLGRLDDQLSLGGTRIEPAEIEAVLDGVDGVRASVVTTSDPRPLEVLLRAADPGWLRTTLASVADAADPAAALAARVRTADQRGRRLVAHLEADADLDPDVVAAHVADQLPAALRPRAYGVHPRLPRTPNGKLDRRAAEALALPDRSSPDRPGEVPEAVVARVAAVASRLLETSIGPDDDLFDHGAHSLLAVALMADLDEEFGVELAANSLYEDPTPRRLAERLWARSPSGTDDGEHPLHVPLQPDGAGVPLFAVHVLGTNGAFYRPLIERLGRARPVHGLSVPYHGPGSGARSLAELVDDYRSEVERLAPTGPVCLAAVSAGSIVAVELARLLLAAGRSVELVLFDATGPDTSSLALSTRQRLEVHGRRLVEDRWAYLGPRLAWQVEKLQRVREKVELKLRDDDGALPDHLVNRQYIENNLEFLDGGSTEPYPGDLTVLKATEDAFADHLVAAGLGWEAVVEGELCIEMVPGAHLSMLAEPHVAVVAEHVRAALERAERQHPIR